MDKSELLKQILAELEKVYQGAVEAAQRAYDTATDEENEAENKYDTMGLEASYLAQGQSQRVIECEADLLTFKQIKATHFLSNTPIAPGALVHIEDEHHHEQILFLSPVAGGQKIKFEKKEITLITPSSPLGQALSGSLVGDEMTIKIAGDKKYYEIIAVY